MIFNFLIFNFFNFFIFFTFSVIGAAIVLIDIIRLAFISLKQNTYTIQKNKYFFSIENIYIYILIYLVTLSFFI